MNGMLNILVRVTSRQAQAEIRRLKAEIRALEAELARTNRANAGFNNGLQKGFPLLSKWGNQVQWAGRQLQYNFTLPLLLAGGAAVKWQLDNEKAMVRVIKVYGDGGQAFQQLTKTEIPALERAFEALSNKFGVHRAAVIDIAGDWAAAGASGIALARGVEATLEAMILGEMEATEATEALIAIQAQYSLSTKELSQALDVLNMIENETGITMQGLIQGFARAAGTARSAGVDIRHLGALMAALVPASGSATNAGNALRTMMSRLMSPTKEAAEVMSLMGINTADAGWKSLNAVQRIERMAQAYEDLGKGVSANTEIIDMYGNSTGKMVSAQQAVVSSTIASRWQINRWDVLMRDVASNNGYYAKALEATADATKNYKQRVFELNAVLSSNPQKMKQAWVILQNSLANVVQPMIPALVYLAQQIAKVARAFSEMDPGMQKLIGTALIFLALIGPITRYIGSVAVLLGLMSRAFGGAAGALGSFGKSLFRIVGAPFRVLANGIGLVAGTLRFFLWTAGAMAGPALAKAATSFAAFAANILRGAPTAIAGLRMLAGAIVGSIVGMAPALFNAFIIIGGVMTAGFGRLNALLVASYATLSATGRTSAFFASIAAGFTRFFNVTLLSVVFTGWAKVHGLWIRGMVALAYATTRIGPMLTAANAAVQYFLFTVLGGIITRGWAFITRIWIGAQIALGKLTTMTVPAILASMNYMMYAVQGVIWRGWMAVQIATVTAWQAIIRTVYLAGAGMMFAMRTIFSAAALGSIVMRGFAGIGAALMRLGPMILVGLRAIGPWIVRAVTGPWGIAISAVMVAIAAFRDQIVQIWGAVVNAFKQNNSAIAGLFGPLIQFFQKGVKWIEDAFWRLPAGIRDAFLAVINVVKTAALKVYEWMGYLNPFVRHSPSLVESVNAGMAIINKAYASTGNIGQIFSRAARDLTAFKKILATMGGGKWADERADIAAVNPGALKSFDALVGHLRVLDKMLAEQERAVARQEAVVDKWQAKLDQANRVVDAHRNKLDGLEAKLDKLTSAYQAHQDALNAYAEAPIIGMKAMSDAMFENEMAQKRLQLQLLKMGGGAGIDDMRNRLAMLAGDIETLRGNARDLRMSGAGSDVLGPINAELAAMEAQYQAMESGINASPVNEMQKQLEELQRQGQIMDLERSIKFDPLTRQIDDLAKGMKELPFDQIINGINRERNAMAALQPQIDSATKAVNAQKSALDQATASRDAISTRLDTEKQKLELLNNAYRYTADAIREIEQALNDMGQAAADQIRKAEEAARKAKEKTLTPAGQNFMDAAGGFFPDVGGTQAQIGRDFGMEDQSALIDEFTKGLAEETAGMFGEFDMFAPIKEKWNQFKDWWNKNVTPVWNSFWGDLKEGLGGLDLGKPFTKAGEIWDKFKAKVNQVWETIKPFVDSVTQLFGGTFSEIWESVKKGFGEAWDEISGALDGFKEMGGPILEALQNMWKILKPYLGYIIGAITMVFEVVFEMVANIIGPLIGIIGDVLGGVIDVIVGIVKIIVGIFTGDFTMMWEGIKKIFSGIVGTIFEILGKLVQIVWGLIQGFVEGIVDFFVWLWDVLVGHSIIPDMVNAIIDWFKKMWDKVVEFVSGLVDAVVKFFQGLWDNLVKIVRGIHDGVTGFFKSIWDKIVETVTNIVNWTQGKWDAFKTKLIEIAAAIYVSIRDKWNELKQKISDIVNGLVTWVQDKWNAFKTKLIEIAASIYVSVRDKWNSLKTSITDIVTRLRDTVTGVWDRLKEIVVGAATYIKDKAVERFRIMRDNILGAFNYVKDKIGGIFDKITGFIKSGINAGIKAVNKLIDGLNAVARILPGLDWKISAIPLLAEGGAIPGRRVGAGFVTSGARAIVGEGKAAHPEFVIPTDPSYRDRAMELYQQLGNKLGVGPEMGGPFDFNFDFSSLRGLSDRIGEIMGGVGKGVSSAVGATVGAAKNVVRGAASAAMKPLANAAQNLINGMQWEFGKKGAQVLLNKVLGWVQKKDEEIPPPGSFGSGPVTGSNWSSITSWLRNNSSVPFRITSTVRKGNPRSRHYSGKAVDLAGSTPSVDSPALLAINRALLPIAGTLNELIYSGPGGQSFKNGRPHNYGPSVNAAHHNHVHAAMANGGIVKKTYGGKQVLVGEGGSDEAVIPLPSDWPKIFDVLRNVEPDTLKSANAAARRAEERVSASAQRGTTIVNNTVNEHKEYHFHGDLSFPNITDGNDAEEFVRNLEGLVG